MLIEFINTGDSLKESDFTSNINERAKYTANTGTALVSVANPNLDGTGTIETVLTATGNGTLVKNIIVKAIESTTRGMIRIFISGSFGGSSFTVLIDEIEVPAVIKSSIANAFEKVYDVDYYLPSGALLMASTEQDENFIVTAEGLDISYP